VKCVLFWALRDDVIHPTIDLRNLHLYFVCGSISIRRTVDSDLVGWCISPEAT